MDKGGWVYIMTNKSHTVLYVGVTSDIRQRVYDHKSSTYSNSFTSRYKAFKLVYYDAFESIEDAIDEEKRIKAGSRLKKIQLISEVNPQWNDLTEEVNQ